MMAYAVAGQGDSKGAMEPFLTPRGFNVQPPE